MTASSSIVANSHALLWNILNVAWYDYGTDFFIILNLNINSCMWLAATVLDSVGIQGCFGGIWLLQLPDSKILFMQRLWLPYRLSRLPHVSITYFLRKYS